MPRLRLFILTSLAMIAFAGNSLLCRQALKHTAIDPATFTSIRIISGALALWLIVGMRTGVRVPAGSWRSALALFAYAAAFSFAYRDLSAGTGALLLFGAVQSTMILDGLKAGERLSAAQSVGLCMALGGLIALLLPGLSAPPLMGALLMIGAGVAWAVYSLRGKRAGDPLATTAGNFVRSAPFSVALSLMLLSSARIDAAGIWYAVASGAVTSGLGYAIWYAALRGLKATSAATVQLSVPVIAAIGGVLLLSEPITLRLLGASAATLGGIALVIVNPKQFRPA
jgi:drug/metabolite transporter (DMT)-like permease